MSLQNEEIGHGGIMEQEPLDRTEPVETPWLDRLMRISLD